MNDAELGQIRKEARSQIEKNLLGQIEREANNIELAGMMVCMVFPNDVCDAYKAKIARIQTIAREANVQIQEIIDDQENDATFALMAVKQSLLLIEGAKITLEHVKAKVV